MSGGPTRADRRWDLYNKKILRGATYELRAIAKAAFYTGVGSNETLLECERENKDLRGGYAEAVLKTQHLADRIEELEQKLENAELIYVSAVKGRKAFRTAYEEGRAMIKKLQAGGGTDGRGDEGKAA